MVTGDAGIKSTYAEQWRSVYALADVDRALRLAPVVDLVFQVITFDDIVISTEPMSRWEHYIVLLKECVAEVVASSVEVHRMDVGPSNRQPQR